MVATVVAAAALAAPLVLVVAYGRLLQTAAGRPVTIEP